MYWIVLLYLLLGIIEEKKRITCDLNIKQKC